MALLVTLATLFVTSPTDAAAEEVSARSESSRTIIDARPTERYIRSGRYGGEEHRGRVNDSHALKGDEELPSPALSPLRPRVEAGEVHGVRKPLETSGHAHAIHPPPTIGKSRSLGSPTDGTLLHGVGMRLSSEAWHFIPSARSRRTNHGTPALVTALQTAARDVQTEWPRARLLLGNLSFKKGGDLPWSVSHNSGRDADVAFYVTNAKGADVLTEHFVYIRRNGHGAVDEKRVLFDAPRNWRFVRNLLTNPHVDVQWMFVSSPIRKRLLDEAARLEEPEELIARASTILHQPSDSNPHADHFHIRLYCGLEDTLSGCTNIGPMREGVRDWTAVKKQFIAKMVQDLGASSAEKRREACTGLANLKVRDRVNRIARLAIKDPVKAVRKAAYQSLKKLTPRLSAQTLVRLIKSPDRKIRIRSIQDLGLRGTRTTVPLLLEMLADDERPIRDAVRYALRFLTNHDEPVPAGKGPAHLRLQSAWRTWYRENRTDSWAQWMRQGFEENSIRFSSRMMLHGSIPKLIRATRKTNHIGYNAQRVLARLTKYTPRFRHGSESRTAHILWKKWWRKNHRRFGHRVARL